MHTLLIWEIFECDRRHKLYDVCFMPRARPILVQGELKFGGLPFPQYVSPAGGENCAAGCLSGRGQQLAGRVS
jgi:hypothetical protein